MIITFHVAIWAISTTAKDLALLNSTIAKSSELSQNVKLFNLHPEAASAKDLSESDNYGKQSYSSDKPQSESSINYESHSEKEVCIYNVEFPERSDTGNSLALTVDVCNRQTSQPSKPKAESNSSHNFKFYADPQSLNISLQAVESDYQGAKFIPRRNHHDTLCSSFPTGRTSTGPTIIVKGTDSLHSMTNTIASQRGLEKTKLSCKNRTNEQNVLNQSLHQQDPYESYKSAEKAHSLSLNFADIDPYLLTPSYSHLGISYKQSLPGSQSKPLVRKEHKIIENYPNRDVSSTQQKPEIAAHYPEEDKPSVPIQSEIVSHYPTRDNQSVPIKLEIPSNFTRKYKPQPIQTEQIAAHYPQEDDPAVQIEPEIASDYPKEDEILRTPRPEIISICSIPNSGTILEEDGLMVQGNQKSTQYSRAGLADDTTYAWSPPSDVILQDINASECNSIKNDNKAMSELTPQKGHKISKLKSDPKLFVNRSLMFSQHSSDSVLSAYFESRL